jgi:hypothetical protein
MSDAAAEQHYQAGVDAASNGDFTTAVHYWDTAAGMGHTKAQYNLGVACARGKGIEVDLVRARILWQNAAEKGHAGAARMLGSLPPLERPLPPPVTVRSTLRRFWNIYIGIGCAFAAVKGLSLIAWLATSVFRASMRPDLPWYWRAVQEGGTVFFAVLGVLTSVVLWPYGIYLWLEDGTDAFIKSIFYLWYL